MTTTFCLSSLRIVWWMQACYSLVPNKHAGMLIYSGSKNQVRHAYSGWHAANDTLQMTRSCRLQTSNVCSVSPKFVPVYQGFMQKEYIIKPLEADCYWHRRYGKQDTLAPVPFRVLGQHRHDRARCSLGTCMTWDHVLIIYGVAFLEVQTHVVAAVFGSANAWRCRCFW